MIIRTAVTLYLMLFLAVPTVNASDSRYYNFLLKYLKSDHSVKSNLMEYQATISDMKSARGMLLPQLQGEISVGEATDELISNKKYYSYNISLIQDLYNGKKLARYRKSQLTRRAGSAVYDEQLSQRILTVTMSILDYKLALKLQQLRYADQSNSRKSLQRTTRRYKAGDLSKTEVWQFESRVFTSAARLEQAKDLTEKSLKKLMALGVDQDDFNVAVPAIPSPTTSDAKGGGAVKLARYKIEIAKILEKEAFASMLPELKLKVEASKEQPFDNKYSSEFDRSFSLQLSLPLFSGGADYYKKKSETSRRISADYRHRDLLNQSMNKVDDINNEVLRTQKIKRLYRSSLVAAKKNLNGVTREFLSGTKNSIDVLSVRKELIAAQEGSLKAEFREIKLKLSLLYQTGELTLDKIKGWGDGGI